MTEREKDMSWNRPAFERHAQTVLVMLLVALLLWVGSTTQKTAVAVAQLQVEIQHLKAEIAKPDAEHENIKRRVEVLERVVLNGDLQ